MDRAILDEEKLRKAEEIYNRRKMQGVRVSSNSVNIGAKKDFKLFNKMFLQILICIVIYFIFYLIQNGNYVFSNDFIDKAKEILTYDINISEKLQSIINITPNNTVDSENIIVENTVIDNTVQENNVIENEVGEQVVSQDTLSVAETVELTQEASSINQMQQDAEEIKKSVSMIKPLSGTITSRFGVRNPTTETVPVYHTGIDIAASTGTKIISAMDGKVSLVSSTRRLWESYKNIKWRYNDTLCTL